MKLTTLLTAALCLMAGAAGAATVNGTVVNASTSAVVSGQKVYFQDSITQYIDSAVTNSSGQYSITVPSSLTAGYFMVYAPACGYYHTRYTGYTGSSVTVNFAICGGTALYMLEGTVSLGSTANNGPARVYLIRKQYNPTLADTILSAIDSFSTAGSGGYFARAYSAIPSGTLLLKAALQSSHPSYSSFLPTYYTSSLNWSGATPLGSGNFNGGSTNISMIGGTNPGGPGFIGGGVLVGANKSTAVGDPLNNRILLLTNAGTGQAVAYTYSNASGQFSFSNLPLGTYHLFGDALGKSNPKLTITLTASGNRVDKVVFEENNKTFKGHIGGLSIEHSRALQALRVFPNPASDIVQIEGLNRIDGGKELTLTNITGAVVSHQSVAAGQNAQIAIADLPGGVYMLQVQTSAGTVQLRIAK